MKNTAYYTNYSSPVGAIILTSDGDNITGLWIEEQKYAFALKNCEMLERPELKVLKKACKWLDKYFSGKQPAISDLPLLPLENSDFRSIIWNMLCEIPYGKLTTYGDLAKKAAKKMGKKKMSAQAVGGALGSNSIPIIIPCHRVVGANGNLTGFTGGLDKKIKLLKHEGVDMSKLSIPKK